MRRAKLIIYILSITLAGMLHLSTVSSNAQEEQKKEPWTGKLKDGTVINKDDLSKILAEHKKWIYSNKKEGKRADLSKASLYSANLSKASLYSANLIGANLSKAYLGEANLIGADLREADLRVSSMRGATFIWAGMCLATLDNLKLKDDLIWGVSLISVLGKVGKGSSKWLKHLAQSMFEDGKQSILVLFRTSFKETGQRNLKREATYAIEYGKTYYAPWYVKWPKRLLFEWTSGYGLNYLRPLLILSGLIGGFSIPYMISLKRQGQDGIWKEWESERMRKDLGENEPVRLTPPGFAFFWYGLYFSILSAFHIGWRDLNVGSWIARIQPREYTLKATGWVRVVSGVQSLISIYLLALWVLTQFGRPFE